MFSLDFSPSIWTLTCLGTFSFQIHYVLCIVIVSIIPSLLPRSIYNKRIFFFLTLLPKKFSSLTPFEKKFQNDSLSFLFFFFFFIFFPIPAVSNGGTEPMADTCPTVTGWRDWTVFFFVPAVLNDGTDFFSFFFGTTFIYN